MNGSNDIPYVFRDAYLDTLVRQSQAVSAEKAAKVQELELQKADLIRTCLPAEEEVVGKLTEFFGALHDRWMQAGRTEEYQLFGVIRTDGSVQFSIPPRVWGTVGTAYPLVACFGVPLLPDGADRYEWIPGHFLGSCLSGWCQLLEREEVSDQAGRALLTAESVRVIITEIGRRVVACGYFPVPRKGE